MPPLLNLLLVVDLQLILLNLVLLLELVDLLLVILHQLDVFLDFFVQLIALLLKLKIQFH